MKSTQTDAYLAPIIIWGVNYAQCPLRETLLKLKK